MAHDRFIAGNQRARHLGTQDQEIGDEPGLHAGAIDPVIGGVRRDGAQDRRPLKIVERAADGLLLRQQHMIFHVQQPCGVVGALDEKTDPGEPVRVVAQHGAIGAAVVGERGLFHKFEKAREFVGTVRAAPRLEHFQFEIGAVDRLPHFHGQRGAHGARVGAGLFQAVADGAGVLGREGQELDDI